jgi:NAD(P)-dependent dehydrogenase (short-subunit alcohol dehydrogenase family)
MTTQGWAASELPSFAGRTIIVTGANSGLGFATATELARVGARVVLAVRDVARGHEAASRITGDTEVRRLDLADLASVRSFAEAWTGDIDVLINNAGVMHVPKSLTKDGFETQFGVDHLGPFALTNLLLPRVTDRVVTVSSNLHRSGTIDLDDLNWERRRYSAGGAYGQAKLANLLFGLELQRRLTASGSKVRSMNAHPGYAATNLQGKSEKRVQDFAVGLANKVIAQSAEGGALPTLFAASQDIPGGSYVGPSGRGQLSGPPMLAGRSVEASDVGLAQRLWDASEKLTGVTYPSAL